MNQLPSAIKQEIKTEDPQTLLLLNKLRFQKALNNITNRIHDAKTSKK